MRAAMLFGPKDLRVVEVPDARLLAPADAVVHVVAAAVCGADLPSYLTGSTRPMRTGHEFVGIVTEIGSAVTRLQPGQFVIAPFSFSCGRCACCRLGWSAHCPDGGWWGDPEATNPTPDAAQGEAVRVPFADATLVSIPDPEPDLIPALLALTDVFPTGHHGALAGGVHPGASVAVIGDGAVGLSAILAARRLGAAEIVLLSTRPERHALAREFGATEIVALRGSAAVAALKERFDGLGPDIVLDCVGTALAQAIQTARPGGQVGFVGEPPAETYLPLAEIFGTNVGVRGGIASVREHLDALLPDVLNRKINPGKVFDLSLPLSEIGEAYAALAERRAIKAILWPGNPGLVTKNTW